MWDTLADLLPAKLVHAVLRRAYHELSHSELIRLENEATYRCEKSPNSAIYLIWDAVLSLWHDKAAGVR